MSVVCQELGCTVESEVPQAWNAAQEDVTWRCEIHRRHPICGHCLAETFGHRGFPSTNAVFGCGSCERVMSIPFTELTGTPLEHLAQSQRQFHRERQQQKERLKDNLLRLDDSPAAIERRIQCTEEIESDQKVLEVPSLLGVIRLIPTLGWRDGTAPRERHIMATAMHSGRPVFTEQWSFSDVTAVSAFLQLWLLRGPYEGDEAPPGVVASVAASLREPAQVDRESEWDVSRGLACTWGRVLTAEEAAHVYTDHPHDAKPCSKVCPMHDVVSVNGQPMPRCLIPSCGARMVDGCCVRCDYGCERG